jgi:hypothetical protein
MKGVMRFSIGLVKPVKALAFKRSVRATDRAWKEAIFGLGGSSKTLASAVIGCVDGQPLKVIVESQATVRPGTPIWTIETDAGLWAFAGNGAVFNDAGYGPAALGIGLERLREIVIFNPEPKALHEALERAHKSRSQADG